MKQVKKNERSVQLHVTQYEKMISELRAALATANEKVRDLESSRARPEVADHAVAGAKLADISHVAEIPPCPKCSGEGQESSQPAADADNPLQGFPLTELKQLREEWSAIIHERREIQHKMSSLDHLEKDFQHKIALKHRKNDRVECIGSSSLR